MFNYAKNQMLGMSFEEFSYKDRSGEYYWSGKYKYLCQFLVFIGLIGIAEIVFNTFVEG